MLNVWVAPVKAIDQAKPVTADTVRPIRSFFWSPDSTRILFVQDKGGNENWLLYGVELATGKQTSYTDFDKTQVRVLNVSPKMPGSILIGINNRNPRFHDVHRLDLASGRLTLVRENNDYAELRPTGTTTSYSVSGRLRGARSRLTDSTGRARRGRGSRFHSTTISPPSSFR